MDNTKNVEEKLNCLLNDYSQKNCGSIIYYDLGMPISKYVECIVRISNELNISSERDRFMPSHFAAMILFMDIESCFDIDMEDEEIGQMYDNGSTISDLLTFIKNKLEET